MNAYVTLKNKQEKEMNNFPMIFAFSKQQLIDGMKKLGLEPTDTNKLLDIGFGGFILKSDEQALDTLIAKHKAEFEKAMVDDETGENFIYEMFNYELDNHEFCITYEIEDTLDALDITLDDVKANPKLKHGLLMAIENQRSKYDM